MTNPTPRVSTRYGAPMGRFATEELDVTAGKMRLRKIPIDSGGYDPGGAYWGLGAPLWYAGDARGNGAFFRAASRDAAKAHVTDRWPGAVFFR